MCWANQMFALSIANKPNKVIASANLTKLHKHLLADHYVTYVRAMLIQNHYGVIRLQKGMWQCVI